MALLEDVLGLEVLGLEGAAAPVAIGVGALLLAPRLLPLVGRVLRPVAKEVVKVGVAAYDATQATFSEAYQATGDLVAEARHEREQESAARRSAEPASRTGEKTAPTVERAGQTASRKKGEEGRHEPGGLAGQPA